MHKIKQYTYLLLLLPVCWLFHNSNANWHYHQLPNGQLIKHAHPFQPSAESNAENPDGFPFEDHHHNEKDIFFLGTISDFQTVVGAECCANIRVNPETVISFSSQAINLLSGFPMRFPFLRAPPR